MWLLVLVVFEEIYVLDLEELEVLVCDIRSTVLCFGWDGCFDVGVLEVELSVLMIEVEYKCPSWTVE